MIIANGSILPKHKTGGGIDPDTGHAIAPAFTWGKPIPCQIVPNNVNKLGRINGEHFTVASYTLYIEEQPFCAEQVKVLDACRNEVGEFSIISVEHLDAVCQLRILI